jgi:solute carrier family 25 oxoglutarate transporter 11
LQVRIQLSGEGGAKGTANPLAVARTIIASDGVIGLYTGLSAGLLRQATYTTARLGIFRTITNYMDAKGKRTFWETASAGLLAGGLGSIVGTPADLALIRMQADGTLPVDQRRNYKGVGDALTRIVREEGFMSMFKGGLPVVTRACSLNVGMLAGHDATLDWLKTQTSSPLVQTIGAKAVSGFFASAFSLPFDFVKTRIQKQKPGPDGQLPYKSSIHCVQRVFKEEGPMAFYRGFWTYYFRIAPHVMITLFTLDALNIGVKKLKTQA